MSKAERDAAINDLVSLVSSMLEMIQMKLTSAQLQCAVRTAIRVHAG